MASQTCEVRYHRGFSLVDTMVAVVILLIAVIGTSIFRYNAVLDGRKFDTQTTAARLGLMLSESWRGINGDLAFDPRRLSNSDLTVSQTIQSYSAKPLDFTLLGSYTITLNDSHGANYHAILSWKDIQSGLRALNVVVAWAQRGAGQDGVENVDKSFKLTVYTHNF